jgi:hypothetical protein
MAMAMVMAMVVPVEGAMAQKPHKTKSN